MAIAPVWKKKELLSTLIPPLLGQMMEKQWLLGCGGPHTSGYKGRETAQV